MRRESGLTLIEVLIAVAIVSIAFVAVLEATYKSVNETAYLHDKFIAHMILQSERDAHIVYPHRSWVRNEPRNYTFKVFNQMWYIHQTIIKRPQYKSVKIIMDIGNHHYPKLDSAIVYLPQWSPQ